MSCASDVLVAHGRRFLEKDLSGRPDLQLARVIHREFFRALVAQGDPLDTPAGPDAVLVFQGAFLPAHQQIDIRVEVSVHEPAESPGA